MSSFSDVVSDAATTSKNFADSMYGFVFEGGASNWASDLLAYFFEDWMLFKLDLAKISLQASVVVVQDLSETLNLSSDIDAYWMALEVEHRNLLTFFHLPLIFSMYVAAFVTRKMLKFTGVF
jgi:hypothetical protein